MSTKISLGAALTFMIIIAAITYSITMVYSMRRYNDMLYNITERENMYKKLAEIDKYAHLNYIGVIDEEKLMDNLAEGYINGIGDPYGVYLDAKKYSLLNDIATGKRVDIGAVVTTDPSTGYMLVKEVYPDSPAAAGEIAEGNLIVSINDEKITAANFNEMHEKLSGDVGTIITVVVRNNNEDKTIELTRKYVTVPSVYSRVYGDKMGVIRIKEFNTNTSDQFNRALETLIQQGVKGFVFDLRDNPGGNMDAALKTIDRLLPAGVIATSTDKYNATKVLAESDARQLEMPMMVVINGKTASAAELFAQALVDYGKGRVVGTTSLGKGFMQTMIRLDDGSAIDMTVAKFNPPISPNFDKAGITPEFVVALPEGVDRAELDDETDPQLQMAFGVLGEWMGEFYPPEAETQAPAQTEVLEPATEATSAEGETTAAS